MVRSETENNVKDESSKSSVSLDFLEETTGFPKEFIKEELFLDGENINIDELRLKMLNYLEQANETQQIS